MKRFAAALSPLGIVALVGLSGSVNPRAQGCAPLGRVQFVCDVQSPEDLALVPGSEWMITSGNRPGQGAIRAVNLRDQRVTTIFPSAAVMARPDTKTYAACPGPLDVSEPTEKARFAAHGMYLKPGSRSAHTLYVVHHGVRESVEVFEVDGAAQPPALTWIGCVVGPERANFNAVVGLPEGGIAATNRPGSLPGQPPSSSAATQKGAVWEWQPATGWRAIPGSDAMGINGLEVSKDGKWLYIAAWGDQTVIRLERSRATIHREVFPTPFRIDNLRLMPGGVMFAAGHSGTVVCSCPTENWHIGRIDPATLQIEELLREPYVEGFGAATVAVQAGAEIWIGTNRGNRLGHFRAP